MSPDPLITIILPTFRRPTMLPKAIQSVLDQDFRDFTLSIYDNCSNDETPSVVRRYVEQDERIKYHCHAQNIGAAANYSYALREVRTPFFSFLADDDWLLPNFCSSALTAFDAFPSGAICCGPDYLRYGRRAESEHRRSLSPWFLLPACGNVSAPQEPVSALDRHLVQN